MKKIVQGALVGALLMFIWWIGINYGVGMAMAYGANEACNMLRWTLLICE